MHSKSILLAVLFATGMSPAAAPAAYFSEAKVFSALLSFDTVVDGGIDAPSAQAAGQTTEVQTDHVQSYSAFALASARTGTLQSSPFASGTNSAVSTRRAGSGSADVRLQDRYSIGAGSTGLGDGDPAQVLVQVRLTGDVQLQGLPSGVSITDFNVIMLSPAMALINYSTFGLNPPQDFEVDEYWEFVIDTLVGDDVRTDMLLNTDVGGTSMPIGATVENFLVFDAGIRVSPAAGFEGLELVSESGAPTAALTPPGDADRDGIPNSVDNCVLAANAGQTDSDGDGIGNACDPDLNNDCTVDFEDLGALKSVFFSTDADADFNSDGTVDFLDLGVMKQRFFGRPGPSMQPHACNPPVFAESTFNINSTFSVDLDTGTVLPAMGPPADIFYSIPVHDNATFWPVNSALLSRAGSVEPAYAECAAAPLSAVRISLWSLDTSTYVCTLTDAGRFGWLRITGITDPPIGAATNLDIEYKIWQ